jgi:NAD(P)-dependent dehydrogenase (short-subunit alcohol dehydrogenase family)
VSADDAVLPAESAGAAPGRDRLRARRVLVVGAGQDDHGVDDPPIGNGRAIALLCGREGAAVIAADRDEASVAETVRLVAAEGGTASAAVADVSSPEQIQRMCADVGTGLAGVVYNVGIAGGLGLDAIEPDDWDRVMAVNVRGAALVAKAALGVLGPGGSVVFVSSVAAITPGSQIPVYDTSKAALGGLMRHVALAGSRRGIRANVVAPGLMDTPLGRIASRGRPSRARTSVPLGRQGTGWETAYAVVFLLSDESAYVTGQTLVVDGGLTALR